MPAVSLFRFALLILPALLLGCASTPEVRPAPSVGNGHVVPYALSLQGVPYVWGKSSPEEGFDCSGFVKHVYEKHGIALPRTARDMARKLPEVPRASRLPGDLLFFRTEGRSYSHVGIYVGDESFVHAPSKRTGKVIVSSLHKPYWLSRFLGVRRPLAHHRLPGENTVATTSYRGKRRGHP